MCLDMRIGSGASGRVLGVSKFDHERSSGKAAAVDIYKVKIIRRAERWTEGTYVLAGSEARVEKRDDNGKEELPKDSHFLLVGYSTVDHQSATLALSMIYQLT